MPDRPPPVAPASQPSEAGPASASAGLNHRRAALLYALLGLLALSSHVRTLGNGFVFDDRSAVLENPVVQEPLRLGALFCSDYWGRAPGRGPGTWRPLAVLDLWTDWHLGGGAPWLFHLHNLLWHALACLLLALALARRGASARFAALAGGAFALLAVNTEAVAAVVGRADLMAAALTFGAWALLPPPGQSGSAWRAAPLASVVFTAALLCKESAITAVLWIPVADLLLSPAAHRTFQDFGRRLLSLAMPVLGALLLRWILFAPPGAVLATANNNPLVGESLGPRIYTSLALLLRGVRLLTVPLNLSADYSFAEILPIRSLWHWETIAGAALLAGLLLAAWRLRQRAPVLSAASVLLLAGWAGLSHVVLPLPTIFAERLLYLPAAALALALAYAAFPWRPAATTKRPPPPGLPVRALSALPRRRWIAKGAVAALLAANAARGLARDRDWRDDLTLFQSTVSVSPRSARAWLNLGAALQRSGRHAAALSALDRAVAIAPGWASAHSLRGVSLFRLGRLAEAEQEMRLAVRLDPTSRRAARNLAVLRRALRDLGWRRPARRTRHPARTSPRSSAPRKR